MPRRHIAAALSLNEKGNAFTNLEPRLSRRDELKRLLEDRRRELVATLHEIRVVRAEHGMNGSGGGLDEVEVSEVDVQEDIELALIQMKTETLGRIEESIARLEAGVYGQCSSCGEEISSCRLQALPFAVRCRECEEQSETERRRARTEQGRDHPFFAARSGVRDPALE